MTKHPAEGMTKAQIECFERIAIGRPASAGPQTLQALLDRGLIQRLPDEVVGRDRLGLIKVPSFEVPIAIHYQWCKWCSEQVQDEMDGGYAHEYQHPFPPEE